MSTNTTISFSSSSFSPAQGTPPPSGWSRPSALCKAKGTRSLGLQKPRDVLEALNKMQNRGLPLFKTAENTMAQRKTGNPLLFPHHYRIQDISKELATLANVQEFDFLNKDHVKALSQFFAKVCILDQHPGLELDAMSELIQDQRFLITLQKCIISFERLAHHIPSNTDRQIALERKGSSRTEDTFPLFESICQSASEIAQTFKTVQKKLQTPLEHGTRQRETALKQFYYIAKGWNTENEILMRHAKKITSKSGQKSIALDEQAEKDLHRELKSMKVGDLTFNIPSETTKEKQLELKRSKEEIEEEDKILKQQCKEKLYTAVQSLFDNQINDERASEIIALLCSQSVYAEVLRAIKSDISFDLYKEDMDVAERIHSLYIDKDTLVWNRQAGYQIFNVSPEGEMHGFQPIKMELEIRIPKRILMRKSMRQLLRGECEIKYHITKVTIQEKTKEVATNEPTLSEPATPQSGPDDAAENVALHLSKST